MSDATASKTYTLREREELRIEIQEIKVSILLTTGKAEVFGTQLAQGQQVVLQNQKIAVFSWEGCTLQIGGTPDVVYTASDTPMVSYINVHHILHNRRQRASVTDAQGPRTLVVGPPDSGKSALVRMLLNWAARTGSMPTFVDLDVAQSTITVPGCIAATAVEEPTDLEEGTTSQDPLIYFYGHLEPSRNPELYKFQMDRLADVLQKRAESSPEASSAGLFINTPPWIDGLGYELLLHAIRAFKVDVVVVLEQDRLYSQLQSELRGHKNQRGDPVNVIKLFKSGGVVSKTDAERRLGRVAAVREYFYGSPRQQLSPHSQQMATSDFIVFRIGGGPRAPSHALPLGTVSAANPLRLMPVKVDRKLVHSLLAVSQAQLPDQLTTANVAGFVVVTDVNEHVVTFLTPSRGPLPGRYLLEGSLVDSGYSEA